VSDRDEWKPRRLIDGYSAPVRAYVDKQRFQKNVRPGVQADLYAATVPTARLQAAIKAAGLVARAHTAAAAGDFTGAIALFDEALLLAPGDEEALFGKSHALSVLGHSLVYTDPQHARESLSSAIDIQRSLLRTSPGAIGPMINLNSALCDLARTWEGEAPERAIELVEEAVGHIRAALEIAPDDSDATHNLGVTLALAARLAEDRDDLDLALELATQAREAAETTCRLTPDDAEPLAVLVGAVIRLGDLHTAHGEPDEAASCYREAIEVADRLHGIAPGDPRAVIAEARARLAMGGALENGDPRQAADHYESALASCRRILDAGTDAPEVRYWAAQALMALGRTAAQWGGVRAAEFYRQAIEHFRALWTATPDDPRRMADVGFALLRLGQLLEDEDPDRAHGYLAQALAAFERCVTVTPADWASWWMLGHCHAHLSALGRRRGRRSEAHLTAALAAFEHALALRPTFATAIYDVAMTLFDLSLVAHRDHDNPEAALEYLARSIALGERALAAAPDEPDYLIGLQAACTDYGRLLVVSGRPEEGARYLRRGLELGTRAVELDPESWETWWNLSMYHIYTGRPREAFDALRQALRLDPRSWAQVETDPDWQALRDHPTYRELQVRFKPRSL